MAYDVKAHFDHFTMRGQGYQVGGFGRGRRAAGTFTLLETLNLAMILPDSAESNFTSYL